MFSYTWIGECNSERLVKTKRNMDTVPRLHIHPINLPRQLKNILYNQNQNCYVFYILQEQIGYTYNVCIKVYSSEI